jgi:F-box-like
LTINHLPDELLLEIFDSHRQDIDPYDLQWRKKHVWIGLTHVCRKWRAVVFASYSRLDLGITVGPEKPGHIKTILSGPLPIFIDYKGMYRDISGSALWRMRAALKHHHDRVREIAFEGTNANFDKILKMTQCAFPVLESLLLHFEYNYKTKLPDTFLRGPDLPDLHLRRLELKRVSLDSISEFLLSATTVADLSLVIDTAFGPSAEASLLTCLQGLPCLRRLNLSISSATMLLSSTPKTIVPLSKLTGFQYNGHSLFLDGLVAGLSAPSLLDVDIQFFDDSPHIMHLPRFINEIEERYHAGHATFQEWDFNFSLQTQSEYTNDSKPRFKLGPVPRHSEVSAIRMNSVLSAKLTTVEELRLTFLRTAFNFWENLIPWREFLEHFPRLKALRMEGANNYCIARVLPQDLEEPDDDGLAFLSALEEIELGKNPSLTDESQRGPELAAFEPFVSARQQAGRPVKIFFSP